MNFLNNLRISLQIGIISAVVLVGFVVIGGVFYVNMQKTEALTAEKQRTDSGMALTNSIKYEFLNARRREKDFLIRLNNKYVGAHDKVSKKILAQTQDLKSYHHEPEVLALVDKVGAGYKTYQAHFAKVSQEWNTLGLTPTSGLHGELRKSVKSVEKELKKVHNVKLDVIMLMMRRHEKDFMARVDPKYVKRMPKRLAEFTAELNKTEVPAEAKKVITAKMAAYHKAFNKFAALRIPLVKDVSQLSKLFAKMGPAFKELLADSLEDTTIASAELKEVRDQSTMIIFGAIALVLISVLLLSFFIGRAISKPLTDMTEAMEELANGHNDVEVPGQDYGNEIGQISASVQVFKDNATERVRLEAEAEEQRKAADAEKERQSQAEAQRQQEENERQRKEQEAEAERQREEVEREQKEAAAETERQRQAQEEEARQKQQAEEERQAMLSELADDFEGQVMGVVNQVSSSAEGMQSTANDMVSTAEEAKSESAGVAAAAEQASSNVQTVSAAAEQLSKSIAEISEQVSQSSTISDKAVSEAEDTNAKVQGLAQAASKIGEVVELINDIASQTNLLALNATIEAARAGEAGKGFAVVASEVGNLANQTAKATEEISAQIGDIQSATNESVDAIGGISSIIGEINEIAGSISAAVEEQGAATKEIARNVEQAATGTQEVTSTITGVSAKATTTGEAASQVQGSAGELSQQSTMLASAVQQFLSNIRQDNSNDDVAEGVVEENSGDEEAAA